jgi:DNA-binding NtrC family response regulator
LFQDESSGPSKGSAVEVIGEIPKSRGSWGLGPQMWQILEENSGQQGMEKVREKGSMILLVDDDPHILEVLEARLGAAGHETLQASSAFMALELLRHRKVDLMITDVRMPGMGGMELLEAVRGVCPDLPVILLTAYGTIPDAVRAIKAGAIEYLTKPFDGRQLLRAIDSVLGQRPRSPQVAPGSDEFWVGHSPLMRELWSLMERVSATDVSVLILGESGVGKELVARFIHKQSPRSAGPFVVVDCGSTPASLLESELFGHVRGSFTHAIRDRKGLIEAADGGTLFLDEIGNISAEMQVRLLRFLEERRIRKIGDIKEIPVDCRVIAATNVDLTKEVEEGRFREDLYYRLRVVILRVPPLRERPGDIPVLAEHFVERFCRRHGRQKVSIPQETMQWLCSYPWPGNVRELRNALEAGVVVCREGVLRVKDLLAAGVPQSSRPLPEDRRTASLSLEGGEKKLILEALERSNWVQKEAAKLLGISRRVLHYKIRKYGLEIPGRRSPLGADRSPEENT